MPHLSLPLDPEGCVVDFYIGVSSEREAALRASGQSIPSLIRVRGLIDTGASRTAVEEAALRQLGLAPIGIVNIITASTNGFPVQRSAYDIMAGIYHPAHSLILGTLPVVSNDFAGQKIQALIGRDLLKSCLFIYDGAASNFAIAF